MKKFSSIILASAALLTVACKASLKEIEQPSKVVTIEASYEDAKAVLQEDGSVFWAPGDSIKVFFDGVGSKFTSNLTAPASKGSFTGSLNTIIGFDEGLSDENALWAVSPYSADATSDKASVTTVIPSVQNAVAASFDPAAFVTVGKSTDLKVAFYAVCGGVRFSVTTPGVLSVSLVAKGGEALVAKTQIEFKEGVPSVKKTTSPVSKVTLNAPEGGFVPGTMYYISTLPAKLAKGFEMSFETADKIAVLTDDQEREIKRKTFGTIENADEGLTYYDKSVKIVAKRVLDFNCSYPVMQMNPVTGEPVVVAVDYGFAGTSNGPVYVWNGFNAEKVAASPSDNNKWTYSALGVAADGKIFVKMEDYVAPKKGTIRVSSNGGSTWSTVVNEIDQTNTYYGAYIACLGDEAFAASSNNAAGAVAKRAVNLTHFNGTSWTKGEELPGRSGLTSLYPIMRTYGDAIYCFVTDNGVGPHLYKYTSADGWKDIMSFSSKEEAYAPYGYGSYRQEMYISREGVIYIALGTNAGYGVAVLEIDPDADPIDQVALVGTKIPLNTSTAARSCKFAVAPNGEMYILYRNDAGQLCIRALDQDKWDWKVEQVLAGGAADEDFFIDFNAEGRGFIVAEIDSQLTFFEIQ